MIPKGFQPVAVLALGFLLSPGLLFAVSATLKPLSGSVYVQHPNKDLWESVKNPIAVEEGDRIKTNNDSTAFLTMPDDHRVAIAADSYLVLQRLAEGETKIYLKAGSVRSKVRHLNLDLGQYYKVQTPSAVCAVRGTDFLVTQNVANKISQVTVFEGFVDLGALRKDISHEVVHLTVGQAATVTDHGLVMPSLPNHIGSGAPPAPNGDHSGQPANAPGGSNSPAPNHQGPPPPPGSGPGGAGPGASMGNTGTTPPGMSGQGTPPPASNGAGWYENPKNINPNTFKPTDSLLPHPDGTTPLGEVGRGPNGPITMGPEPGTAEKPNPKDPDATGPATNSFNPLSGTGITAGPNSGEIYANITDPTNPTGQNQNTANNPSPPPTGNTNTSTSNNTDPVSAGNQALFDTIRNQNLQNQLQGVLVAGLFQDGSVKLSPVDGQWHLYADAIRQTGPNGVMFLNATMTYNQPGTLNYQVAKIDFNQALPPTPSAYTMATQTAFQGDSAVSTQPSYYATAVDNYRSNTVDYVDVKATGGTSVNTTLAAPRYVTVFSDGQCTVNGTVLWQNKNGVYSYLDANGGLTGTKPTLNFSNNAGTANSGLKNTYANGVYLGRQVTYFDPSTGKIASQATIPSGVSPQQYFGGTYLVAQDTLYSNLFTKGPIMAFGSAQSRVFGGIDSIVNDTDALSILNGQMPVGMPDGLLRS